MPQEVVPAKVRFLLVAPVCCLIPSFSKTIAEQPQRRCQLGQDLWKPLVLALTVKQECTHTNFEAQTVKCHDHRTKGTGITTSAGHAYLRPSSKASRTAS